MPAAVPVVPQSIQGGRWKGDGDVRKTFGAAEQVFGAFLSLLGTEAGGGWVSRRFGVSSSGGGRGREKDR